MEANLLFVSLCYGNLGAAIQRNLPNAIRKLKVQIFCCSITCQLIGSFFSQGKIDFPSAKIFFLFPHSVQYYKLHIRHLVGIYK